MSQILSTGRAFFKNELFSLKLYANSGILVIKSYFNMNVLKLRFLLIIILHWDFQKLCIGKISIPFEYDIGRKSFIFIMGHKRIFMHILFHTFFYTAYIVCIYLWDIFYSSAALTPPEWFFIMSWNNLLGDVKVALATRDVVTYISSTSAVNHNLETDIKYFYTFFLILIYYRKI